MSKKDDDRREELQDAALKQALHSALKGDKATAEAALDFAEQLKQPPQHKSEKPSES